MWVSLPNDVRFKIRSLFNIPQSGNVIVNDGRIETDGVTTKDFEHLTISKMQSYLLDDSTDFHKLFDKVVAKVIQGTQEIPDEESVVVSGDKPITIIIEPKKRGRPSKK